MNLPREEVSGQVACEPSFDDLDLTQLQLNEQFWIPAPADRMQSIGSAVFAI